MKRIVIGIGLCAIAAVVCGTPQPAAAQKASKGKVKCTAAIKDDGTVLSCTKCDPATTVKLGVGAYQVGFLKPCDDPTAANGMSRWVQADPLSTGSTSAYCTTADRFGVPNAIYVQCQDSSGNTVDTSFFLFVAK